MEKTPGLFGQIHSNRDYRKQETWGKNQFNISFPASLVAYMQAKQTEPVYLTLDKNSNIKHKNISGEDLFGMSPLSENLFYGFEQTYQPFAKFYTGKSERIDLVLRKNDDNMPLRGLEVKLTALPDNTTKNLPEDEYSCEIVVRPPTICFVACSICSHCVAEIESKHPDMIIGGPPCQDFSSAGKRDEDNGRGDLTVNYAQIINRIRPKWFVMENVERITKTKKLIDAKKIFKEAGYGLSWQVLDASKCGLAAYISEPIHRKA